MSEKFETEAPGPDVMEAENRTENVDGSVRLDPQRRMMTGCHADDDGDCNHAQCPQLRDKEPDTTGRHCPLDLIPEV